jgi:adenylosuccinate lyase
MSDDLFALSPADGRYLNETEPLRDFFSEFAYIRERVRVETLYLSALSNDAHLIRPLTAAESHLLRSLSDSFSIENAQQTKELERPARHDAKAIEGFLRAKLEQTSLSDLVEYLHFGLTSEDVNNIAQALVLGASRDKVIVPALDSLLERMAVLIRTHKSTPMLARTHGQPAVPTTFGKETAVFYTRLRKQRAKLVAHRFEAKLNGAVGNFNALTAAAPQVDWLAFSEKLLTGLGLEPNLITTQSLPYDNWVEYFNILHLINSILIDLAQDFWRYAGEDHLKLKVVPSEVGSSTLPQKINPIDFENAEGNLGVANSLFEHYARKLTISRLQRDLSDSTVRRTFGVALGHCLIAYAGLARGLDRTEVNEARMSEELNMHWEIISEGAQTILRAAGIRNAFDLLKSMTRGKELTEKSYHAWIDTLSVDESVKAKLRTLAPSTYMGLPGQIVERALQDEQD